MKRVKNILIWLSLAVFLIVSLRIVFGKKREAVCHDVVVIREGDTSIGFITRNEVLNLAGANDLNLLGTTLDSISFKKLTDLLNRHPWVKKAEVRQNLNGTLEVTVEQREPLMRVFTQTGNTFYIDREGWLIPTAEHYVASCLIASGHFETSFQNDSLIHIKSLRNPDKEPHLLNDIYVLAKYIADDEFFNSLVQQIYINKQHEIELIPKVGMHVILMGDITYYQDKLERLKILYREVFRKEGWNSYQLINLKYKNQAVCIPK